MAFLAILSTIGPVTVEAIGDGGPVLRSSPVGHSFTQGGSEGGSSRLLRISNLTSQLQRLGFDCFRQVQPSSRFEFFHRFLHRRKAPVLFSVNQHPQKAGAFDIQRGGNTACLEVIGQEQAGVNGYGQGNGFGFAAPQ